MVNTTAQTHEVAERVTAALGDRSVNWLATETGIPRTTLVRRFKDGSFTVAELIRIGAVLDTEPARFIEGVAA